MEGSAFLNITFSFWTKPHQQSGYMQSDDGGNVSKSDWSLVINNSNLSYLEEKVKKSALISFFEDDYINKTNNNNANEVTESGFINQNGYNLFGQSNVNKTQKNTLLYRVNRTTKHTFLASASHNQDDSIVLFDNLPSISSTNNRNNDTTNNMNELDNWIWSNLTNSNYTKSWRDIFYLNNNYSETMWNQADCVGTSQFNDACLMKANGTSNVTYEIDQLEHEREYWALILIILPILALFGNILVILSVYRERSLQTVTNWFIVSLAFADLFVTIPMLFCTYVMVNVDWELSEVICDLYIAMDVFCSTASIFNLVAISFDRYIAVTHPIFYSKHKNDKRVIITIILVWMASFGVGLPIMLGANTSPERIPELCIFYNSDFIIYSSLWSFYVPCLIMVILYYKIFKAIHDRARKKMDNVNSSNSKNKSTVYSSSKPSVNNQTNKAKNILGIETKTMDNISLSKQLQIKSGNVTKLDQQIKVPIEEKNHPKTSIAIVSEINIGYSNENDNSNNTESRLDDDDDDDDDDDIEDEEQEQEIIEIKQFEQRPKCSNKLIISGLHCSNNNNSNYGSNNNNKSNLNETHFSDPKLLGTEAKITKTNLNNKCDMFIMENAAAAFNTISDHQTHLICSKEIKINNNKNVNDNSSPSCSTSGSKEKDRQDFTSNENNLRSGVTTEKDNITSISINNDNNNNENDGKDASSCSYSKKKSRFNLGRKHKSSRKKREKVSARRERKATKTLAIVLGVFLLCWTPFFSCNILDAICIKLHENHFIQSDCRPGMTAFLLTTWLGYMNSCANPLIYTIFNTEFRKAFRKILCNS